MCRLIRSASDLIAEYALAIDLQLAFAEARRTPCFALALAADVHALRPLVIRGICGPARARSGIAMLCQAAGSFGARWRDRQSWGTGHDNRSPPVGVRRQCSHPCPGQLVNRHPVRGNGAPSLVGDGLG